MFKSLYTRIAIYTITVMCFSALVSFLLTNVYYHFQLKPSNDAKIMRTLKEARSYQTNASSHDLNRYFQHLGEMNYQIMTVDEKGEHRFYGTQFRKDNISEKRVEAVLAGKPYHGIKHQPYQPFITGFFENVTSNTVGLQFKNQEHKLAVFMRPDIGETFSEFRIFLAVLISILLIISISLVISSTYAIIKPIKQLKHATERLMRGDFNTPIQTTRKDELGTLQYRFDVMRQSLKQLDDMRSHFVQNVSHEIKTPLTHIHHKLDLLKHTHSAEERAIYIQDIYQTTTQLSHLTKELLLLAELDNGEHLQFNDQFSLDHLLTTIIRHNQFAADQKDLVILSELEPVTLIGNQRLLNQAFQNIITNAIKYSETGGIVEITVKTETSHIRCDIVDDGPGMSQETMARLFERFYKVSHHENSNGLGLAIAKTIVELHQGRIEVQSAKNQGSTFTIFLPLER